MQPVGSSRWQFISVRTLRGLGLERQAFAAKIRPTRAVLGWSQTELAQHVGLTQRAIHKLEQGGTEPRRGTVKAAFVSIVDW